MMTSATRWVSAMAFDAVLFDLDGTLLDSAPDLCLAANRMRADRGRGHLPLESYRALVGSGARGMIGVAFGIDPSHSRFEELREEFFVNYAQCLTVNTIAFDGVAELIATIRRNGLKWGVVTNKSQRFTTPLTGAIPLFGSAQAIISGDTTPYTKPHPAPLIEAARRLGVEPLRCIYVGDDERDIVAGKAAGMTTVAAIYGYLGLDVDAAAWKADAMIESPLDLLKYLGMA